MQVVGGMKGGRALAGICAAALLFVVGCKKDADAESAPPSGAPGSMAGTSGAAQKPAYSDDAMAFMLGRKFAFSCLYTQLGKGAEASKSIDAAQVIARALGVTPPALPTKDEGFKPLRSSAIPGELTTRKSAKVAAAYSLGVTVTDAWFGAMLGSKIDGVLGELEQHAKAASVPEAVYKSQLDAIKAKPTDDGLEQLASALEVHYKGS